MLIQVPVTAFSDSFPAVAPGKSVDDGLDVWIPATHVGTAGDNFSVLALACPSSAYHGHLMVSMLGSLLPMLGHQESF